MDCMKRNRDPRTYGIYEPARSVLAQARPLLEKNRIYVHDQDSIDFIAIIFYEDKEILNARINL